jgi:hypothetical protein
VPRQYLGSTISVRPAHHIGNSHRIFSADQPEKAILGRHQEQGTKHQCKKLHNLHSIFGIAGKVLSGFVQQLESLRIGGKLFGPT